MQPGTIGAGWVSLKQERNRSLRTKRKQPAICFPGNERCLISETIVSRNGENAGLGAACHRRHSRPGPWT